MTTRDPDPVAPRFLTVNEVAERLQTKPYNVREWIRRKRLRATKPFETWLIREDDLQELLDERANKPKPVEESA